MARHHTDVPLALSISLAARLAGLSRQTFRERYLQPGLCHLTTELDDILHGVGVGCVWTWELAQALGRKLTVEEVQAADIALDRDRKGQRNYRKRQGSQRAA
jgi:hypothetical protein